MRRKWISIKKVVELLNVSEATIRNWLKAGYFSETKKGYLNLDEVIIFIDKYVGKEKLISRANKSKKDNHNHGELVLEIEKKLPFLEGEVLSFQYEKALSNSFKNKEGIYYTPLKIVEDMLKSLEGFSPQSTFLDPSCGSGNFLVKAIERGVSPEKVFGFDTDPVAVMIARKRIYEKTGFDATCNIKVGDFLEEAVNLKKKGIKFDFIYTNPPWGKKIKREDKLKYAQLYQVGKSYDTSALFLGASLDLLAENGILGFLLPESFFKIGSFIDIRKKILEHQILSIVDYGKVFPGLLTRACSLILKNIEDEGSYLKCRIKDKEFFRNKQDFKYNPKIIFNFWLPQEEARVIERVYSIPHLTLKGKAKWGLGIVTGNNKKYCSSFPKEGYIPVYKGADITKMGLKEPSCFIPPLFEKYQQVAPLELYQAKEKIIYRFISSNLVFFYDNKQRFILNSANFFIPNENLGVSAQKLANLLNSDFINWLFQKIFSTHKILRSDLEELPLHLEYFSQNEEFREELYLDFLGIKKSKNSYKIK